MSRLYVAALLMMCVVLEQTEGFMLHRPAFQASRTGCKSGAARIAGRVGRVVDSAPAGAAVTWTSTNPLEEHRMIMETQSAAWRVVFTALAGAALLNLGTLDGLLVSTWGSVQHKGWLRHDLFEPWVAMWSFFFWIHGWLFLDVVATHDRAPARLKGLRRYRIQDQTHLLKLQQAGAKEPPAQSAPAAPTATTTAAVALPQPNRWYGGWFLEFSIYMLPLFALSKYTDIFAARRAALAFAAPTFLTFVGQIFGGLVLYDGFFFMSHLLMHRLPSSLYRIVHGKHHRNSEVRASDSVRLDVPEEVVNVLCSISALRLLQAHPLSRAVYNVVITFMLVELHSGWDLPWMPQNLYPRFFAGSRRHHAHHKSGNIYFQKFFQYLDNPYNWLRKRQAISNYSI
ncbi:hypothetical protein B484DRAFT_447900 [Ochromonadaceae sp. CCMP2298]|nr:hypothetical protein B484DRAFT_447900 [Ochromonadaceae sp. CCMP2298]